MSDLVKCKVCGIDKIKNKVGKRKTGSIFVNEAGVEWNGLCCAECNRIRSYRNMTILKHRRKQSNENS